jgi:hypothetical protein
MVPAASIGFAWHCRTGEAHGSATTISMLPDEVSLEISDFYRNCYKYSLHFLWNRYLLVMYARIPVPSLNLRILRTYGTPVKKTLGIWQVLPIALDYSDPRNIAPNDEDNWIAALEPQWEVCRLFRSRLILCKKG